MADKKGSKPSLTFEAIEIIVGLILIFGVVSSVIVWANKYRDSWLVFYNNLTFYLINFFAKFVVFSFLFSIAMFVLLIIYARKYQEVRKKIMKKILPANGLEEKNLNVGTMENSKWNIVLRDIDSNDASKWKLAILEADIILNDLLDTLSLSGESMGDKLKAIERSEFNHLDEAWEAHKIRNAIAHGGSDFLLTQREAKRVIELYKKVFTEFEII